MYRVLGAYDAHSLSELKTAECTHLMFEPQTYEFINTDSWKTQLATTLSNYSLLIPNTHIHIPFNGALYTLRIVELLPKADCTAYKIKKGVACDVAITNPTRNDEEEVIPFLLYPRRHKPSVQPFTGRGTVLGGGRSPLHVTPGTMCAAAATTRAGILRRPFSK